MIRRLLAVLSVPAVVAASLSGVTPSTAASSAPGAFKVTAPVAFSPDGDGVQDRVPIRITLPNAVTSVDLEITSYYDGQKVVRTERLGTQPAGVTTWTWDGRSNRGKRLPDGTYLVEVQADWVDDGVTTAPRRDVIDIDTTFQPRLSAPTYGVAGRKATYRVFPRSTAVRDALPLDARVDEAAVKNLRLVIRDDRGRVVRDDDVNRVIEGSSLGYVPVPGGGLRELKARGRTVPWSGRRGAKPLPAGRYTAVVTGKDRAGNTGRSRALRIFVSREKLVWRDGSTDVAPADSRTSDCELFELSKCGDLPPCAEVVDSTQFPDGLSYRSGVPKPYCSGDRAVELHILGVPDAAVRGVAAATVSFTGAPTNAGEPDTGTLTLLAASPDPTQHRSVSGTAGTTGAVANLWIGRGISPSEGVRTPPSVVWRFETTGGSWVDVASFRVDYRYLAVKG